MPAAITTDIDRCAAALRQGELVAFGTETVYGLGANALDATAVARIFAAKQRPAFDPLIVHVAAGAAIDAIADTSNPRFARLRDHFWPGPLTILLPRRSCLPDLVTSGLPEVGVRIPDHPQALELLQKAGLPVAAPSANLFGCVSPTTAAHVAEQLGDRIPWILDGGPCRVGVESTVVRLPESGPLSVLRLGGTTLEQLREVVGEVEMAPNLLDQQAPQAPGQLAQHYAPRTPLSLVANWLQVNVPAATVALRFQTPPPIPERFAQIEILSPTGSLIEAAAKFFAALRRLDAAGHTLILAEEFPQYGLGRALNDRLQRAAASRQ